MEVRRATTAAEVLATAPVFDHPLDEHAIQRFLGEPSHHLLIAWDGDVAVGFVRGSELLHPTGRHEMLLYELGVAEGARRRGAGRLLVEALRDLSRHRGCAGMWVLTDADNEAALRTYRTAGAGEPAEQVLLDWSF